MLEASIIARGPDEYVYFINPLVFFNGDRVTYVEEYIKVKAEEETRRLQIPVDPNQISLGL
ncbi:hypothetical protein [Adhaeribacter aquaticus]|uniref:hypothetical protein n=1 Tax=Adhaeribacter aquaticus TaxID=299567 RepID=UPI0004206EBE|nr:hypothetical protein [Adhaeribacter aquaticus]